MSGNSKPVIKKNRGRAPLFQVENLYQEVKPSGGEIVPKTDVSNKRGRKRALSTSCLMKEKKKPKTEKKKKPKTGKLQQPFKPKTVKNKCPSKKGPFIKQEAVKTGNSKPVKKNRRSASLYHVDNLSQEVEHSAGDIVPKNDVSNKRGRKRALSTSSSMKEKKKSKTENKKKPETSNDVARGKKSPVPGLVVEKPYYTVVGDPDTSWYLGLDSGIKPEDLELSTKTFSQSAIEVPRWREKHYSPIYNSEGTENLDDKVFEKRHRKLELEEKRQLRWHMQRIREQKQVERQRQRQKNSWYSRHNLPVPNHQPHKHDIQFIEITPHIQVSAFGQNIPDLPESEFFLPWMPAKPLRRSMRRKTIH